MVKTVGFKTQTHEATASQRTIYHEKFDTLEKNHWSKQLYLVKSREFQIINYNYNFTFF